MLNPVKSLQTCLIVTVIAKVSCGIPRNDALFNAFTLIHGSQCHRHCSCPVKTDEAVSI